MTYIYVKKDLTFIADPAAQGLLKAFLNAVYTDEYITQCEEEFGFVRVSGDLRDKALSEIESLTVSSGAPEFTFELDTLENVGQGDYIISWKRESFSEVEQADLVEDIDALKAEIEELHLEIELMAGELGHTHDEDGKLISGSALGQSDDSKLQAALIMSAISIVLWILAVIALLVRCVTGTHTNTNMGMPETAKVTPPETA